MSDQALAFAGTLQCGELVRQIAASGLCGQQAARDSIATVFRMDAATPLEVYGGSARAVRLGLKIAVDLFSGQQDNDALAALNYTMAMTKVGQRLMKSPQRQHELGHELELIKPAWQQSDDALDPAVVSQLADAYQRHISTLDFRITVNGKPEYLKSGEKISQIRALLLAGLRSAFLWRQLGGRQWKLVFQRKRLLKETEALLAA